MKKCRLNVNDIIYNDVYFAETFFERFKGLMFNSPDKSYVLLFKNCNSIHTCFMKYDLDIFCLDKNYTVIKIYKSLSPFRLIFPKRSAAHILEIPSSFKYDIKLYDAIKIVLQ